jgi:methionyl-tRNA formyltransferase
MYEITKKSKTYKPDLLRKTNFVFFGTPEFADIVLKKLIDSGFPPALVVCNPDRPVGRKKTITPPPVKITAQKHGIETWQPEKLEIENCKLKIGEASFAIVAAYAKIIPLGILKLFPADVMGIHPSLLPKHRGSSPIQATILGGDDKTGITLYLLDEKIDHGPILAQRELAIFPPKADPPPADNFPILLQKLAELGGELLIETLPKFLAGELKPQPQNESEATYTKKFTAEDAFVDIKDLEEALSGKNLEKALAIDRKIRALNPEPGVWTYAKSSANGHVRIAESKRLKLLAAEIKNGRLLLHRIQTEGEKPRAV